jgi:hypothetical protein
MAYTFSQGYMRGEGDPNLDVDINNGGGKLPKLYIDDLTDSIYSFDDSFDTGSKWVLLFSGFVTKVTDIKVLLSGPFSGGVMTLNLAAKNLIPLIEPYEGLGYVRVGFKSETVSNLSVFTANSITDWILVELRDKNNPEIVRYNRAGLLKNNGQILDVDGVTPLTFVGIRNEPYFIAIKHRNHIGLMTQNAVDISSGFDFTTNTTNVYGLDNRLFIGIYGCLKTGKTFNDGISLNSGRNGISHRIAKELNYTFDSIFTNVYNVFDFNFDGNVSYIDYFDPFTFESIDSDYFHAINLNGVNFFIIEQIPPFAIQNILGSVNKLGDVISGGNTSDRNGFNEKGTIRFNNDVNKMEYFNGTTWIQW